MDAQALESRPTPLLTPADWCVGLWVYFSSSVVVLLAMFFGSGYLQHPPDWEDDHRDYLGVMCRYDGNWYLSIVERGYWFIPDEPSNTAFFPAYPISARVIQRLTDCRPECATLIVSHLCLALTLVLFHAYLRLRGEQQPLYGLLAFAIFPTTFFLRTGYTESMFCLFTVLMLVGCIRRWHPIWLALIAGFATAIRAPGVALGFVLLYQLWQQSASWGVFIRRAALYGTLSCWGLFAYIAYQAVELGEPLAFAKAQNHWNSHANRLTWKGVVKLVTLEPIWNTYNPKSGRYWPRSDFYLPMPFSMQAANPVYFVLACAATVWGWRKRVLSRPEVVLALGLLLVPYISRAHFNSMGSFGRFAAVVLPVYIVFGRWLQRLPSGWAGTIAVLATFWLIVYAALFSAGWWII